MAAAEDVNMRLGTALASVFVLFLLLECPQVASQPQCPHASRPEFKFTVNESSKSVSVFVEPGHSVTARAVYRERANIYVQTVINSSVSKRSAVLIVPYILPCLCVQVYFRCWDSKRHLKCLPANSTLTDVTDVWLSTKVGLKSNSLTMTYLCPAAEIEVSTALCWKHGCYCTVVSDLSVVEQVKGRKREYNTSAVDKHPQMCVRRSLLGSHNVSCHFKSDMSSWMVHVELMRHSLIVYINSSVPAIFSAQMCKLRQTTCAAMGRSQSLNTKQKMAALHLSVLSFEERPCVQVWQSEPALYGKRILCPEYARSRYGIYAVVALVFVITVMALGICFYYMIKKDTAGWFYIQRPVLLVCSSEDAVHISTVCALASILQGDFGATVHLALWAQSSQSQYGMGVADVGPLPWLYGQWDSVVKAQGNVLIIWSLDAMIAYKKWWGEKESSDQKNFILHEPHKMEETETLTAKHKLKRTEEHTAQWTAVTETCTVVAPVFKAALTCLMGALQTNKPQRVAFICLNGHNNSKDLPKAFRSVPRYCLPHQFSGLIQELGVKTRLSENSRVNCWTGLLSKVLRFWLGKQLERRLQMLLPPKSTDVYSGS